MNTKSIRGKVAVFSKAPGSAMPFGIDLVDILDGAELISVTAVAVGVTIDGDPFVQGTCVAAHFAGLDENEGATNSCTFTWVSSEGTDSATIYFKRR